MDSSLIEENDIHSVLMSCSLELNEQTTTGLELKNCTLSELPPSPNWPLLRVLSLQGNAGLMEIPSSFFDHLPLLHTLDLSYTSIKDLPGSLYGLMELRALYLRGCELFMELQPGIGQLKKLEELDLNETQITHVPTEIQELINLQKLSLSFYEYDQNISEVIPNGLISKLTRLSYLRFDVNPEHSKWEKTVRVILQEIAELVYLRTLILYVPTVELLKYIPERKDLDFQLIVGHHMQRIITRVPPMVEENFKQSNRSLRFVYGNDGDGVDVPQEITGILRRTKTFFLDRHMTIKNLSEFGLLNFGQLQVCIIAECNEMLAILDKGPPCVGFPCLEVLSLFYMKNLRGIWEGSGSYHIIFGHLKSLTLHTCPNLITVFNLDCLYSLFNLEELLVQDCPNLTTLITPQSLGMRPKFFLSRLRKISLFYLPELVSISNGLEIGPNLEKIKLYYCPKLQNIFTRELCSKGLKVIKGETEWWEALRWNDPMRGQNLKKVFSPIDEEVDIMSQFVMDMDEYSIPNNIEIHAPFGMKHQQVIIKESLDYPHSEQRLQSSSPNVDMPAIDGFIWRGYALKHCIGGKFRYNKCAHPNCPVKKRVKHSLDGLITEIIYKGQHNHRPPQSSKHTKASDQYSGLPGILDEIYQVQGESLNRLKDGITLHSMAKMELESSLSTDEHLSGSDSKEVCDPETEVKEKNDEPDPKRRNTDAVGENNCPEPASSHRTVSPKIIVHTAGTYFLDYGWRQYHRGNGKDNRYLRYYECTTPGCNARKQVEGASEDHRASIITYARKQVEEAATKDRRASIKTYARKQVEAATKDRRASIITSAGKQVEAATKDHTADIITFEGKHNHGIPAWQYKIHQEFLPFKVDTILGMRNDKD